MFFVNYDEEHYKPYENCPKSEKMKTFMWQFLDLKEGMTKLHVAAIVLRGKVLAFATNQLASRTCGAATRGSQNYIHAEKNVLGKIKKQFLKDASMYIMRVGKINDCKTFQYSQPCPECTVLLKKCMKKYGLRNVYFTV